MTSAGGTRKQSKISPGLASRLGQLKPGEKMRVIVMLRTPGAGKGRGRQGSTADREAAVKAVKEAARSALGEVDDILARLGGRRLADEPDALGSIPVKATAPAIRALARSGRVKAVMEDQSIHLAF